MKTRLELVREKMTQYPYAKHAQKMTAREREIVTTFIAENDALYRGAFELKVNRMFLNQPEKPKRWVTICELLTVANSAFFSQGDHAC